MKKTILVLTTSFPALTNLNEAKRGGFFMHTDCLCLVKAGYDVHVLAPLRMGLPESESGQGIVVTRFHSPLLKYTPAYRHHALYDFKNPLDVIATMFVFMTYLFEIRKYVRKQRIDLVWANWLQVGFVARLALGRKMPILTTVRGSDVRNMPGWLTMLIAGRVKYVLSMFQDDEMNMWRDKFRFEEIYVPMLYRTIPIRPRSSSPPAARIVVIGRLENHSYHMKYKGIGDQLFSVLGKVTRTHPQARFTVIGGGSKIDHFRSLCSAFSDKIEFTGWRDEFEDHLSAAGFVIGASGLAGVTLDTVPYGIPVIVSKYDPSSFFWKHEHNCLIYDPLDEENYLATVIYALENPERMRQIAQNAKDDLSNYALPLEEAADVWKSRLEEFMRIHGNKDPRSN